MTNAERRYAEMMKKIYNETDTMIHERNYVPKNCVICDVRMKSVHDTHNPHPIKEFIYAKESNATDVADRCCTFCNDKVVMPKRIKLIKEKLTPEEFAKKRLISHLDLIERPSVKYEFKFAA